MKSTMHGIDLLDNMKKDSERAARKAAFSPFVEFLARLGFAARGAVYLMMGIIALQVAAGTSSMPASQQGALAAIGAQPAGHFILILVMIGLAGYSLWGLIRAIFDPLHVGNDSKGMLQRLGFLISAATYAYLMVSAYGLIKGMGGQTGSQTSSTQQSVSSIMAAPWGRWFVGIAGIIVIGVGLAQIYQGLGRRFDRQFRPYALNHYQAVWIKRIGRFGIVARGVVFAMMGGFLALAAYQYNPAKAQGIDGALLALARQPYGGWLLGIVALGLIAFGFYSITGAAWFRLRR